MVGLPEMPTAADSYGDGEIYLLPAWPKDWNADFKLHAPRPTTVEATARNGKAPELKVTPKSRRKDVVIPAYFKTQPHKCLRSPT